MTQIKKSAYRLRVFTMPDGTTDLVFGNDPAPEGALLIKDQDVITETTVTDHVEAPVVSEAPVVP